MNAEIVNAIQFDEEQVDIAYLSCARFDSILLRPTEPRSPCPLIGRSPSCWTVKSMTELYEANREFDKGRVTPYLTPVRVPVIGSLWQGLRWRLHSLVTFYVWDSGG